MRIDAPALLPHRPPMLLLDALTGAGEETACAEATLEEGHAGVAAGRVLEAALIECVAQTVAAWKAHAAGGGPPAQGLLAGVANVAGMCSGYLFFLATRKLPSRRKIAFELNKRKAAVEVKAETMQAESRNHAWDPKVREAVARAAEAGAVAAEDEALLAELDAARDESITVCGPAEFGYVEDDTCRTCPGFAE